MMTSMGFFHKRDFLIENPFTYAVGMSIRTIQHTIHMVALMHKLGYGEDDMDEKFAYVVSPIKFLHFHDIPLPDSILEDVNWFMAGGSTQKRLVHRLILRTINARVPIRIEEEEI